jgi:formylglycine-generating enzyme required for sulfatase activity
VWLWLLLAGCDGDGLSPLAELRAGTGLTVADSDGDGKSDGDEVLRLGTDPLRKDTDGDGVNDGVEERAGTDPLVADAPVVADAPPKSSPNAPPSANPTDAPLGSPPRDPADLNLPALRAGGEAPPDDWRCDRLRGGFWIPSLGCFLEVPAGAVRMGAQREDPAAPGYDAAAQAHEAPVRVVQVPRFWIQQAEVTAGLYRACVDGGGCSVGDVLTEGAQATWADPAREKHPITGLTWDGAARVCAWLGGRLPTEAEWERAARGEGGRVWPWGDEPGCGYAPDRTGRPSEAARASCADAGTRPVEDSAMRSAFGLINMAGNVWEWTADWYGPYDPAALTDPRGPTSGTHRVQRGGGWLSEAPEDLRASARAAVPPGQKLPDVGARCVWGGDAR